MSNKTAVVTGGVRGIGRAISEKFLKEGYEVIAVYNGSSSLAKEFQESNENLTVFEVNVGNEEDLKKLFKFVNTEFTHLNVLVNNAGIDIPGVMKDYKSEDWDKMIAVNLKSVFLLSQLCVPLLENSDDGVIINISSRLGMPERVVPTFIMYGITKAGINTLTAGMAKELADQNIRVNAVLPTATKSDMLNDVMSQELQDKYKKNGKLGSGEDVAKLVMELVEDEKVTGKILLDPRIA